MPQADYYERQEARRERYELRAERARQESDAAARQAEKMASIIPMGQPILVGHHSEGRDRRYRARIGQTMDKAISLDKKAAYYEEKAECVGQSGISSDAPDALERLDNKAFKKGDAALLALGMTQAQIDKMRATMSSCHHQPYPQFSLANNSAEIRRIKVRIEKLKATAQNVTIKTPFASGTIVDNVEENRLQILFDDKPDADTRTKLKSHGFRWSPRNGAWQRMRSNAATYYAKQICGIVD